VNCVSVYEGENSAANVEELVDFSSSDLTREQALAVRRMLNNCRAAILLHKDDLGRTSTIKHFINGKAAL
jgi:hypothetical protein